MACLVINKDIFFTMWLLDHDKYEFFNRINLYACGFQRFEIMKTHFKIK